MSKRFHIKRLKPILLLYLLVILASLLTSVAISRKVYMKYFVNKIKGAVIHTSMGDIKIKYRGNTERATENFIYLAKSGFYDKTKFHRVVPGLLIEGGDPLSKNNDLKGNWGFGGPGYTFPDEVRRDDRMQKGVVAMANTGPDTNGSRFFILADDAFWLNGYHTIFADVVGGMDVVSKISEVETSVTGLPLNDIEIIRINYY